MSPYNHLLFIHFLLLSKCFYLSSGTYPLSNFVKNEEPLFLNVAKGPMSEMKLLKLIPSKDLYSNMGLFCINKSEVSFLKLDT